MSGLQNALSPLLLPPLGLVVLALLAGLLAGLLAAGGRRWAGWLAGAASLGVLLLATPLVAGLLTHSLAPLETPHDAAAPGAIIILGGDVAQGEQHGEQHGGQPGGEYVGEPGGPRGTDVGLLTLERLRAGAALHRASGLPILVTGGSLGRGQPPLAQLMARSLEADFGVTARWVEPRALDTRDNATFAAALLRADGVASAWVVTQRWHMPRAQGAFARQGFPVQPAPVRQIHAPRLEGAALLPRADHLTDSWFALHEWAGRAFYALRDGFGP